jgi:hypothetical protein
MHKMSARRLRSGRVPAAGSGTSIRPAPIAANIISA